MSNTDFDPDAYLATPKPQGASSGFNPDAYLAEKPSAVRGVLEGLKAGASAGWSDEIAGLMAASGAAEARAYLPPEMQADYEKQIADSGGLSGIYHSAREEAKTQREGAQAAHPYLYGAGELGGAGATMALLPVGEAAAGAGLAARALPAVKAGAAYGAAQGAAEGQRDNGLAGGITGGVVGGVTGGVLGGAGSAALDLAQGAIRPITQKIGSAYRALVDPELEAAKQLATAAKADFENAGKTWTPLTAEQRQAADTAGLPRAIVDVMGPQTRALGEWAATVSPDVQQSLKEFTTERLAQQRPRVAQFIQDMTGGGDLNADSVAIKNAGRVVNRQGYAKAMDDARELENSGTALWDDDLKQLVQAPEVQNAIRIATPQLRNWAVKDGLSPPAGAFDIVDGRTVLKQTANGNTVMPGLQLWDYVKRGLDSQGTPTAKAFSRVLRDKMDEYVPGYADARAGAASFFGARDALTAGAKFASPQNNMAMGEARAALGQMTNDERNLFARGFATQLSERVLSGGGSLKYLENPQAMERMSMALGPDKANQLEALLRAEQVVNSTRGLYGGSPTAKRLAMQAAMGVGFGGAEGGYELLTKGYADPRDMLVAGLPAMAIGRGTQILNQRLAAKLGDMLLSDNPAVYARGIQLAARTPAALGALRRATAGGAGTFVPHGVPGLPVPAAAQGDQNGVEGPVRQKDGGRAVGGQQPMARGGGTNHGRNVGPLKGVRKARDGRLYVADKTRPGKFLVVVPR